MQNGGTRTGQFNLDDFNLNSDEALWGTQAGRDPRAIGNKVISAPNSQPQIASTPNTTTPPELGRIVNLEMPPASETASVLETSSTPEATPALETALTPELTSTSEAASVPQQPLASASGKDPLSASLNLSFDKSAIKTTEKLSKSGVTAIKSIINTFHHQDNPKDFYDTVRGEDGILAANLKQSYNRTIGES